MLQLLTIMHPGEVTELLQAWRGGDERALDKLTPLVYGELRHLARSYMSREQPGHTLQTTALVHEAYARLVETPHVDWQDRNHFYAVCAMLMRRVLVDYARSHAYQKRGGGMRPISLAEAEDVAQNVDVDLFLLDQALTRLAAFDPRKAQVVELRFFGGLTIEETSQVLRRSRETVMRDWKFAKAWLLRELDTQRPREPGQCR
jgi:RNA polymerase sigma-70 factor (ECF subfamily)